MFERPARGEAAVLVALDFGAADYAESLQELELLAASAGASVRAVVKGRRNRPDPALFAGSGKVREIAAALADAGADLAIFNHELSPAQQLENLPWPKTEAKVVAAERRAEAKARGYEGEMCGECGNFTLVRNGTCMKCDTCGSTTGCS